MSNTGTQATSLRRQMDKAVQLLSQTVTELFARRTHEDVLEKMGTTDSYCSHDTYKSNDVERHVLAKLHWPLPNKDFTEGLDNVDSLENGTVTEKCQNELPVAPSASELLPLTGGGGTACRDGGGSSEHVGTACRDGGGSQGDELSESEHKNCQNELAGAAVRARRRQNHGRASHGRFGGS
jgi:hypothetical protein